MPAAADTYRPSAVLQCSGDDVAIRFGGAFNDAPLTYYPLAAKANQRWSSVPFAKADSCTLANGNRVVLHAGEEQARPYGMGGGNPPAFFSLWINERKVLARLQYKAGYAASGEGPYLNSVFVSGAAIEQCAYPIGVEPRDADADANNLVCTTKAFDLAQFPVDTLALFPVDRSLIGTISIAATYSPAFCEIFVSSGIEHGVRWTNIWLPERDDLFLPLDVTAEEFKPSSNAGRLARPLRTTRLKYWNSDEITTLVEINIVGMHGPESAKLLRHGPVDANSIASLADIGWPHQLDKLAQLASSLNWQFVGHSGLTTSVDVFQLNGETYQLDIRDDGSATLYRPNRLYELEPICRFQPITDTF